MENSQNSIDTVVVTSMENSQNSIDTVVVPSTEENFKDIFLKENRWHSIRIKASKINNIENIAIYQTAPISAITHYAKVTDINECEDNAGKYVLNFKENPIAFKEHIKYVKNNNDPILRSSRYTNLEKLKKAKTLKDIFN